jgi:hypothetical protein
LKKYTKKEIREIASTAMFGVLARLEMSLTGKAKKIVKDGSKQLTRAIEEEHKKQLKKFRKKAE